MSAIAFLASLLNQRVWDDEKLLGDRLAAKVSNPIQFWREPYWGEAPRDTFRPLGLTVLYAERRLFGESMLGFHLVSLVLHGLTSLALLAVFQKIAAARVAWFAAVLFAIHPVHAEAVSMAYGQLELMAALFSLLAIGRYLAPLQNAGSLAICLTLAFSSVCCKESGLMLPGILIMLRGLYVKYSDHWTSRWLTWREAAFALPALLYLALRRAALGRLLPPPESTITYGYTTALRLKAVIISLGSAIRLSLFPTQQTLYYGHLRDDLMNVPWTEIAWIATGALIAFMTAGKCGWRTVSFGVGWFLITLFPVLNVVPSGVLVAERNLYLPVAGVVFLGASLATRVVSNRSVFWITAVAVAVCALDSNFVVSRWRDSRTLWRTTVENHPTSPMAQAALGNALLEEPGQEDEAEECFRRALELNPELAEAKHGMGRVAMRRGDYVHALAWLEQAQTGESSDSLMNDIRECRVRLLSK